MKTYWSYDIFESRDTRAYEVRLASEVDAEIADMRAGFALELASKNARIAELDAALTEAVGLFNAQKEMYERSQARIAELETLVVPRVSL